LYKCDHEDLNENVTVKEREKAQNLDNGDHTLTVQCHTRTHTHTHTQTHTVGFSGF